MLILIVLQLSYLHSDEGQSLGSAPAGLQPAGETLQMAGHRGESCGHFDTKNQLDTAAERHIVVLPTTLDKSSSPQRQQPRALPGRGLSSGYRTGDVDPDLTTDESFDHRLTCLGRSVVSAGSDLRCKDL